MLPVVDYGKFYISIEKGLLAREIINVCNELFGDGVFNVTEELDNTKK